MAENDSKEKDYGQYRRPSGNEGHAVVESMNHSHYELTSWGLAFIPVRKDDTLLDIGCGGGVTAARLAELAPDGKVTGVDHSPDCVRWAADQNRAEVSAGRVRILQADVDALPFPDSTFDKAFAVETVYFWPDLAADFAEARRVLKPGGLFVIIHEAYACERFREKTDMLEADGKMRVLSPDDAKTLLLGAGFSQAAVHTWEEKNWMCCIAEK